MKRFTILPILMLTLWSGCSKSGGGVKLHTDTDSVAYVIGLNVGANLLKMDSTLNAAAVCKGIADYFAGRQSMTMEEAQTFYLRYVNYAVPEKIREQERRARGAGRSGAGGDRRYQRGGVCPGGHCPQYGPRGDAFASGAVPGGTRREHRQHRPQRDSA